MCFGGDCGASIDIGSKADNPGRFDASRLASLRGRSGHNPGLKRAEATTRPDFVLFNETPATFLVEVENEKIAKKLFAGIPHKIIGQTVKDPTITVTHPLKKIATVKVDTLKEAWQKPMKKIFH